MQKKILTLVATLAAIAFAQQSADPAASIFVPEANANTAAAAPQTADPSTTDSSAKAVSKDTTKAAPVDSTKLFTADTTKGVIANAAQADSAKAAAIAKADTTKATAVADTAKKDTAKVDSVPAKPKPRGKMTVADYNAKQKARLDSINAINFNHGISVAGALYQDKRYGSIDDGFKWSGGMGIYYSYRRYLLSVLGLQGRAGFIYRYGRFDATENDYHGKLKSGNKYDLTRDVHLTYDNFAFDIPLTFKVGGHIEATTFLYAAFTFGVTKPLCEFTYSKTTVDLKDPSKELEANLKVLGQEGDAVFPLTESKEINKAFFMDDWETNGWVGVGIDGKYLSAEAQVLVASGSSTYNNHRYHHLFRAAEPTMRFFVTFSMR